MLGLGPLIGVLVDRGLVPSIAGRRLGRLRGVSIGLLVALQGLVIIVYGPTSKPVPAIFPDRTVDLGAVNVGYDQIAITAIAARRRAWPWRCSSSAPRLGLDMRAVVDDPQLAELTGANASRTTTLAWILGSSFAALAGVLLAPTLGADALLLTLLVVQAFGAAALGRLVSLPIAYAGALGLGVLGQLSIKWVSEYAPDQTWLSGRPAEPPVHRACSAC